MMPPPPLTPECPRGHGVGSSGDRRVVAVGLVLVGLPFLLGAAGSIVFAGEAIGPLITFAVWIAMLVLRIVRSKDGVYVFEWLAVMGCIVTLQLLLDLHTRFLGDIAIGALHAVFAIAALIHRALRN